MIQVGVGNEDGVDTVFFQLMGCGKRIEAFLFRVHAGVENDAFTAEFDEVGVRADFIAAEK